MRDDFLRPSFQDAGTDAVNHHDPNYIEVCCLGQNAGDFERYETTKRPPSLHVSQDIVNATLKRRCLHVLRKKLGESHDPA